MRIHWTKRAVTAISIALIGVIIECLALASFGTAPAAHAADASATAELDIVNNLVTNSGGVLEPADFIYQINGGPETHFGLSGVEQLFLDPSQTYTITEVPASGYTTTSDNCTDLTLDASTPTVCTITNDDIPPATTTLPTTTTLPPASTTTMATETQKTVHDSSTDANTCHSALDPKLQPDGNTTITVDLGTNAFPQPHKGDPITLSGTTVGVHIPATLLQLGVDANLIHDGEVIPATVAVVVAGHNTAPASHTFNLNASATIHVKGGKAQPLSAALSMPTSHWTPVDKNATVYFVEKSLTIVATLNLPSIGVVTATFSCLPTKAPPVVALGAFGAPEVVTTTTRAGGAGATVDAAAIAAANPGDPAGQLPLTGGDPWPWAALGALCVGLGLAVTGGARRARGCRPRD